MFYIIVHPDSGYPTLVYGDEVRAKEVADINKYPVVEVVPTEKGKQVLLGILKNAEVLRRKTGEHVDEWLRKKLSQ